MSTFRTPASASEIQGAIAATEREFYPFDRWMVCPMCGLRNAREVKGKVVDLKVITLEYVGTRRWRPRRWFRRVGYHACRCSRCGARWRELPREGGKT